MAHAAGDETTAAVAADGRTERPGERHASQGCWGQQEQHLGPSREDVRVHSMLGTVICCLVYYCTVEFMQFEFHECCS